MIAHHPFYSNILQSWKEYIIGSSEPFTPVIKIIELGHRIIEWYRHISKQIATRYSSIFYYILFSTMKELQKSKVNLWWQ